MPSKTPTRRISRLGLDSLLNQIVSQASQQYPPTGTTTATIPTTTPPSMGPQIGVQGSSRPGQNLPLDRNGDYFVAEGLPAGATPSTSGVAPPGPVSAGPPTGTTTTSIAPSGVNALPASAPVNGGASGPSVSQYRNIGEIYAEQPESNDPASKWRFNQDRLTKIGKFYGLSDEQISQAQANVSGMLALAIQKPGITPVEANQIADQMFQAEGTRIVKENDQGAYDLTHSGQGGSVTPQFQGQAFGADSNYNPLSVYGVYTPEQIAAIQGQIGQYVNQAQDRYSQAAGGWRPSPAMQDAYARQAQAIPAVQALEGQHALAQELARVKEQNLYYQMMAQMPQSDSSGSGSMSDSDMAAFVDSIVNGKG